MGALKKVVIAGGGTAGWMSAAAISKLLNNTVKVTLIESEQVPTVGVGEATIPTLHILHKLLGIDEQAFIHSTQATIKLGIQFEHWHTQNSQYMHSFGRVGQDTWAGGFHHFWLRGQTLNLNAPLGDYIPEHLAARQGKCALGSHREKNYAYHLDAGLYADFLKKIALDNHTERVEGMIKHVITCPNTGFIRSLQLASGQTVDGDLFIDCTGFHALLIDKALHSSHTPLDQWLLCNKAVAIQTELTAPAKPYTRAIAHSAGWQWQIPLQNRQGNGLVFCDTYLSEDEAVHRLLTNLEGKPINAPRVIPIHVGHRQQQWRKNCVAIGLSGGFIEPLESTGIHLFQRAILQLLQLFPQGEIQPSEIDTFNAQAQADIEHIRDFIILHYHLTERTDSAFWQYCKNMEIPQSLQRRIDLFSNTAKQLRTPGELFHEDSWVQVMLGQGLTPKHYHPVADRLSPGDLQRFLEDVKHSVAQKVTHWPTHEQALQSFCGHINETNQA